MNLTGDTILGYRTIGDTLALCRTCAARSDNPLNVNGMGWIPIFDLWLDGAARHYVCARCKQTIRAGKTPPAS